jgi:hypothetical protein
VELSQQQVSLFLDGVGRVLAFSDELLHEDLLAQVPWKVISHGWALVHYLRAGQHTSSIALNVLGLH